jgi:enoyl-CoA hydratase/3-hydroxyacyl-CoA dehydrogenase
MAFVFRGWTINKIGVIGSGQIGPDIALHFTKVFHPYGVNVVVVDVVTEALEKGAAKLKKKVEKGVKSGAFKPEMGEAMVKNTIFTSDYEQLRGADLVVEAASEDLKIKQKIFSQLEKLCPETAILTSNSSHLEPEVIFEPLSKKNRAMVTHYFFPAERNPMVEVVPGKDTDAKLTHGMLSLYERIGKVPIRVGSRYGYAVDPIFEGLFLANALAVEEGLGTVKEVDAVGTRALGLTVGSFTAMNLTGGNPLTDHGLEMEGRRYNIPWFHSPKLMKDQIASSKPWEVAARGEKVELPAEKEKKIADTLLGAYFGLAGMIIDSGIVSVADLEMALEIALDIKPPFRLMNQLGVKESLRLVEDYAKAHDTFPVPQCIKKQASSGRPWEIMHVRRHDVGDVAWVRIRRPKVLNALNPEVFAQLKKVFTDIKNDSKIKAVVLSGYGTKAFVSGADINFLAGIKTPQEGIDRGERSKEAGLAVENLGKPVIAALNGLALGGGIELAMCCSTILVTKGLKVAAGQPEVNLGIIPGAGGTQRLPRWIGLEKAQELLRTGKPISSAEGVKLGLFSEEIDGDNLIEYAIELARKAAAGQVKLKGMPKDPIKTPDKLPDLELGHLSRKIDEILCRTIIEGCRQPLEEGLHFESEMFGECVKTEDTKIGIQNFLTKGPRSPAPFVHK